MHEPSDIFYSTCALGRSAGLYFSIDEREALAQLALPICK
jgi:hypothetical protein